MVYGGEQKPGTAKEARARGRCRGPIPGTRRGLLRSAGRWFSGGYALAGLALLALWGAWSLGVLGCSSSWSGYTRLGDANGTLFANMRQSPEEISRLERNAHYYKLMGQPELGLKEMELAHQENPDNLQITDLLARNYEDLGKFEAARQLYQEGLTRHGPHAVLTNNLCFSYYREGRWQKAETCFRQALAQDPGNVSARNNLGLLYCRLGRQDEAHQLWQEAEGGAAADAKMRQALAVLGMPSSPVYARRPESSPPAARVTQAPTSETGASGVSAAVPAKPEAAAHPVTSHVSAGQLAANMPAPQPTLVAAKPPAPVVVQPAAPAPPPVAVKPPAATPTVVAAKPAAPEPAPVVVNPATPAPAPAVTQPPAPTPAPIVAKAPAPTPIATQPQPEPMKQAAVTPKALVAAAPAPASQAAPPLTTAERVGTAIEVRNGTHTKNLAHQTKSLLQREGFSVARIGNQRYSDKAKTTIYYRPGAERVAWELCRAVSLQAELVSNKKLKKGINILVLLRDDLLENPQFMARLKDGGTPGAPPSQPSAATDTLVAAKTEPQSPAASHQDPPGESPAAGAAEQQPLAPKSDAVVAQPLTSSAPTPLTAAELMSTAIEVRNGTWTKNLARKTRSLLQQEGFTVAKIGNHIDFGATKTMIYYRPGAERVARAVGATVFPPAELEPSLKLKKNVDIKILLGADLLERPLLMARLFAGDI